MHKKINVMNTLLNAAIGGTCKPPGPIVKHASKYVRKVLASHLLSYVFDVMVANFRGSHYRYYKLRKSISVL